MSLPKILDGTNKRLNCISISVNQNMIPLSSATIQVMKEDTVPIRTFVEIETPNGVKEVYRTRQPQVSHTADTATIQLDHAICEVGDYIIQDSIKEEKTVSQALSTIFSHYRGSKWQLATITASETVSLDCDHDNVLETILSVLQQVPKYVMTFNFNTTPWTVGISEKTSSVTAEGRLSRNITDAVVKYDDKDLCTRVYVKGLPKPTGHENDENAIGYMDADSETLSKYGIVEATTGSGEYTLEQAQRVATAYLAAHKAPKLSIEISGEDLYAITGESLDSFVVGKKFRLVVPEDNLIIEDYITKVSFSDIINSNQANIVIGDEQDAALNFMQQQASNAKSSKRYSRKADKEMEGIRSYVYAADSMLYSYIEQTATYIVSHLENEISDVGSEILQTANQIRSEVHASESSLYSYVDQTATYINSVVMNTASDLGSAILQTANQIRSEVHASESSVYSYVDQTATSINQVVANTASGLQSSINQTAGKVNIIVEGTGSNAHIKPAAIQAAIDADTGHSIISLSADQIELDGNTKLSGALDINNGGLRVKKTSYFNEDVYIMGGNDLIFQTSGTPATNYTLNPTVVAGMISKAEVSGNNLKLWKFSDDQSGNPSITFSKAASQSGTWGGTGNTFPLTISDGINNYVIALSDSQPSGHNLWLLLDTNGTPTINGSNNKYVDAPVRIYSKTDPNDQGTNRYTKTLTINATAAYNKGWDYGITQRTRSTRAATSQELTIKSLSYGERWTIVDTYTKSNGSTEEVKYTVSAPSDRYETGWSGCYGTVGLNNTTETTLNMGGSVTVYAQAKASSSASSKTNVASRIIRSKQIHHATLDSGGNHVQDYWNMIVHYTDGTSDTYITDQVSTGLYLPVTNIEATENNKTYYPSDYGKKVFDAVTVNVPSGTSHSVTTQANTSWHVENVTEAVAKQAAQSATGLSPTVYKMASTVTRWCWAKASCGSSAKCILIGLA